MDLSTFLVAKSVGLENIIGFAVMYVYLGYTVMVLAHRLQFSNAWMAWIPFANMYLMARMARVPGWWAFGFFVPIANLFVAAYIWSEIGKRFGRPWWIGILVILAPIGLLVPGYFVLFGKAVDETATEPKAGV